MRKRIILALCDYGATGISESLMAPLHHFHKQGHEIWQLALGYDGVAAGVDRERYPWVDRLIPITPASNDNNTRFGQFCLGRALQLSKAEIVLTSFDAWMVSYLAFPERFQMDDLTRSMVAHDKRQFTHVAYFPIDGAVENKYLPPTVDEMLAGFDVLVTYSRFGQKIVRNDVGLEVPFIPIAHDPAVYHPGSKIEARKQLGLDPDDFIVGMVATNQYRKLWGEFFDAVVPLLKDHPNVKAFPWTNWQNQMLGGTEIVDLVWRSGCEAQIINPGPYAGDVDEGAMATMYRSLDVLVLTTVGEGAGLPPLRARASGVPALVSANTSNIEFAAHEYELIPTRDHYLDPMGSNIERYRTDTAVLNARLNYLYDNPEFRKQLGRKGVAAMRQYEIKNVMPLWDKLIEEIA